MDEFYMLYIELNLDKFQDASPIGWLVFGVVFLVAAVVVNLLGFDYDGLAYTISKYGNRDLDGNAIPVGVVSKSVRVTTFIFLVIAAVLFILAHHFNKLHVDYLIYKALNGLPNY